MKAMKKVNIDGTEYEVDSLTDTARKIVQELRLLEANLQDKQNIFRVFNKAKTAYTLDLKNEIIKSKAGLDFLSE